MSCSVDIVGYSKLVIDKQTELAFRAERDPAATLGMTIYPCHLSP